MAGSKNYRVTGIILAIAGFMVIILGVWHYTLFSLTVGIGFELIASLILWIEYDMRKSGTTAEGRQVPQKYSMLFVGAIFFIVGGMLTILGFQLPDAAKPRALIPSIFSFILGIIIIMVFVVNRVGVKEGELISSDEEILEEENRIGGLIGIIVACIVLGFFFLLGLLGLFAGQYVFGLIFTVLFGSLMGGLIYLYKRHGKKGKITVSKTIKKKI